MTDQNSQFTGSLERLINATVEKLTEDGRKKIGGIVSEVVRNASTTNGIDPATELIPFAKDILSLSGDQPLTLIKIAFQQVKVRAVPTPKFVKAARTGNLTYDNGIPDPDGLSITQLPQTLQGTELEQIDLARLLNMDENGTITENDTLTLHKSILPQGQCITFKTKPTPGHRSANASLAQTHGPASTQHLGRLG
jgi:hypothetical protein